MIRFVGVYTTYINLTTPKRKITRNRYLDLCWYQLSRKEYDSLKAMPFSIASMHYYAKMLGTMTGMMSIFSVVTGVYVLSLCTHTWKLELKYMYWLLNPRLDMRKSHLIYSILTIFSHA